MPTKLPNISKYHKILGKVPDNEIAKKYNVCRERIAQIRKLHNIPAYNKYRTRYAYDKIPVKLLGTKTDIDLAAELGISSELVGEKRKKYGIQIHKMLGSKNTRAKLTESQVIDIKKELKNYKRGMFSSLARKYNGAVNLIRDIYVGRTWSHIKID